jgi:hypothetical protein
MAADATPRRKAAMFASLTSDLRWRRPVPLGTRRLDYSLNNSRKLRPKTCDSQQTATTGRAGQPPPPREGRTASFTACLYPKRPLPGVRPKTTVSVRAPWRFILFCS